MGNRELSLAEDFRRIISQALYFEMRDPQFFGIVITKVRVTPDLSYADIRISLEGEDRDPAPVLRALKGAGGALRKAIVKQVRLKRVPQLRFHLDEDAAAERKVSEILAKLDIPPSPAEDEFENEH